MGCARLRHEHTNNAPRSSRRGGHSSRSQRRTRRKRVHSSLRRGKPGRHGPVPRIRIRYRLLSRRDHPTGNPSPKGNASRLPASDRVPEGATTPRRVARCSDRRRLGWPDHQREPALHRSRRPRCISRRHSLGRCCNRDGDVGPTYWSGPRRRRCRPLSRRRRECRPRDS